MSSSSLAASSAAPTASSTVYMPRADVEPGMKIWASMILDKEALEHKGRSTVTRRTMKGQPMLKQAFVINTANDGRLIVAPTDTFAQASVLPERVRDASEWYPVSPTPGTSFFTPLPAFGPETIAEWIYLGKPSYVSDDNIMVFPGERLSEDALGKVINALK